MHIYSLILQIYALIFSRSKYLSYFFYMQLYNISHFIVFQTLNATHNKLENTNQGL